ncbi:hypothetical protein GmHk_15G044613 [Glycine max]|nr:hypothetical protein GmHk_15G044613 [Glycine max]
MGEAEEVQEKMKTDMEARKEQMTTMMEAMMSLKKIMEANAVAIVATSVVAKVNPMPPSGLNQMNHPTSTMVGKDLGSTSGLYYVQIQNKHGFPPYGLPPNYTPPIVAYTPKEDVNNSAPILIESQQPQSDHAHVSQPMGETHEMPHHNLADFEPCLGYATEGQAVGDTALQNTLEGPQYHPQPHPLHYTAGKNPHAMAEMGNYTPSSFMDLIFTGERIKAGLKRGRFDHPALMNAKTGANEEGENEGETHAVTTSPIRPSFPLTQQCHYSSNNNPSPYPPPSYPQRPSLNQPQNPPTTQPMLNTTFSTNQNTNQGRNFAAKSL